MKWGRDKLFEFHKLGEGGGEFDKRGTFRLLTYDN